MADMIDQCQDQATITNLIGRVGVLTLRSGGASFRTEDIMRRVAKVPMWASILAPVILGFAIPFWGFILAPPLLAVIYAYKARGPRR